MLGREDCSAEAWCFFLLKAEQVPCWMGNKCAPPRHCSAAHGHPGP